MKTKQLLTSLLVASASMMLSQTTINVRVNSSLDDHEERISGALPQSGTIGDMDAGSSDLELGNESATADPQLVGVRFASVTIPPQATIVNAYIQFAVDAFAKNTDPCVLSVQIENSVNPSTFSDNAFSLSSRSVATSSVTWNVSGSTWSVVGSAGPDQRTPDLKSLIQPIVNNASWVSGNALAFFIKGTGTREVEAFDGDPLLAPELVITYSTVTTGINELDLQRSANIYPNPFKSSFNMDIELVDSPELSISIYDAMGKLIEQKNEKQEQLGTYHFVSKASFTKGIYFVHVKANNSNELIKVISE
jgi:hypothetical protein